jgi:hypothetical protein
MADLKSVTDSPEKAARGPGPKSATQYPYFDLDDSIAVGKTLHEQGGGTCTRDLVAAALGYSTTKSGTFLSRIYAAKLFGLISIEGETLSVTDRATSILHPVLEADAIVGKRDAFLAVPLFQKVYEKFRGATLPPELGIQNLLKTEYKIVPDRIKAATRVMLNSAEQAGFFVAGNRNRLIAPTGVIHTAVGKLESAPAKIDGEGGQQQQPERKQQPPSGGDGPTGVHPALVAMLRELPRPGTPWPKPKKDLFMTAFRSIMDVIYPEQEVPP